MRSHAGNNDQFKGEPMYWNGYIKTLLSVVLSGLMIAFATQVLAQSSPSGTKPPQRPAATGSAPGSATAPPASSPSLPAPSTSPAFPPGVNAQRPPLYTVPVIDEEVSVLIVASEETTLSSQMGGRILRVHIGLGETVAMGAPLLEFDCSEQQAQLQSAQAEYRGLRETHLTKLKLQALGAAGELEVTVAAATADKAKSQVDVRESQLAYCKVSAPFSGKIARLRVKASESVNLGQPLVELVNTATLKAQMFVPSAYIRIIKPGAPFQIKMDSGQVYRARVAKINSRVEGVSQQLEVEGQFDGSPQGLLPGMVGTAIFPGRPSSVGKK